MKKLQTFYMIILPCFFALLLFCSLFAFSSTAKAAENPKQNVVISLEQYNRLKKILTEQEQALNKLQWRMNLLEMPLNEQVQLLEKCENELSEAKQSLEKQTLSLDNARLSTEKLKTSLTVLEKQVNSLEKQSKRRAKQRDIALDCCAILLVLLLL